MNTKVIQPRIVAGKYKNFKLQIPENTRPITERVKITMFDILKDIIVNSSILDLFAASGNIGIEALSRGSKLAIFVDSEKDSVQTLKTNLINLGLDRNSHKIFNMDYLEFARTFDGNFDIIFLDPPFKLHSKLRLDNLTHLLAKDGVIVYKVEDKQRDQIKMAPNTEIVLEKKIGINILLFIKLINNPPIDMVK